VQFGYATEENETLWKMIHETKEQQRWMICSYRSISSRPSDCQQGKGNYVHIHFHLEEQAQQFTTQTWIYEAMQQAVKKIRIFENVDIMNEDLVLYFLRLDGE
jgi:IS1 family transposase